MESKDYLLLKNKERDYDTHFFTSGLGHLFLTSAGGEGGGHESGKDATQAKSEKISGIISFVFKQHEILFLKPALLYATRRIDDVSACRTNFKFRIRVRAPTPPRKPTTATGPRPRPLSRCTRVPAFSSDLKSLLTLSHANACHNVYCDTQMRVTMWIVTRIYGLSNEKCVA